MTDTRPTPADDESSTPTPRFALGALAARLRDAGLSRARSLHTALGVYLTVSLGLSVLALWGFAWLAEEVFEGETAAFDRAVLTWLHGHGAGWLDRVAVEATALGSTAVLFLLGLVASLLLWHLGRHRHVALIWLAATGSLVLNQVLKTLFGRSRPDVFEWLVDVGSLSFPSGHAMNAMVFYTVLAYVLGRAVGTGAARTAAYVGAGVLIAVVGLTRMYLGVHYPSDVLAGYIVGYAWATLCMVLVEARGGPPPPLPAASPSPRGRARQSEETPSLGGSAPGAGGSGRSTIR